MHLLTRASVVAGLLFFALPAASPANDSCLDVLDFEGTPEGAIVTTVTGAAGTGPVAVRATNPLLGDAVNAAVVFDSSCTSGCTGGDADLGTPNADFGGPGSGSGGALGSPNANSIALGNHLIVAEDVTDADGDGLVDDPDDQGDQPVSIHIDFAAVGPVTLAELTLVDNDANRPAGSLTLLAPNGAALATLALPVTGDNGVAIVDLAATPGVRAIALDLEQSAAIDNVVFEVPCDDGDPCTVDRCENGSCVNAPIDGCVSCSTVLDCDDGNQCTDDVCGADGVCSNPANAAQCDDGIFCNGADTCADGWCNAHAGDPCTGGAECANTCDELNATCSSPAGTACTDDGNVCTDNICDGAGGCVAESNAAPCDDGLFCNGADQCLDGSCSLHDGDPCAGGGQCAQSCDEGTESCLSPAGTPCADDGNLCTDDICDGSGSCVAENNAAACDDGLFCNGADTCVNGECAVHAGDPCTDGTGGAECAETCDEAADGCFAPHGTGCTDDGNACTDNICDGQGACVPVHNTAPCEDGDACTGDDACEGGVCIAGSEPCAPGSTCDEQTGACRDAPVCTTLDDPACDDGNPCTDDSCIVDTGQCANAPNSGPCDDGVFCNGIDACEAGVCSAHAGDPCTGGPECASLCDEAANTCALPAGTACGDDGNPCTDDACDGQGLCDHPARGGSCDDGAFCNGADACSDGSCQPIGEPPCAEQSCDEAVDTCDPAGCASGVVLTLSDAACPAGTDCSTTVSIETGGAPAALFAATLTTTGSLSCGAECTAGEAATGAECAINPGSCEFALLDAEPPVEAFADGVLAVLPFTCHSPGRFPLDLAAVVVGDAGGTAIDVGCTIAAELHCTDAVTTECPEQGCDDGLFCNGVESCSGAACEPGAAPCAGACDEQADACVVEASCIDVTLPAGVICTAGASCTIPVFVETRGAALTSIAVTLDAGPGTACEACSAGGEADCAMISAGCQLQVDTPTVETSLSDGLLAAVTAECAAPQMGEICVGDLRAVTAGGYGTSELCNAVCVPYACTPAAEQCVGRADCDDGVACTIDCCAFDAGNSTMACTHEDNECSGCAEGPRLAGVDALCTVGESCEVAIRVESGIQPIATIGAMLEAAPGLTLESLSLGACGGASETIAFDDLPVFNMATAAGTAYCDGDAVVAHVRCEEPGATALTPTDVAFGDDTMPVALPLCGGCGAAANVVCVAPELPILCGDATFEGRLSAIDSLAVLRHTVGLAQPCPAAVCDVDGGGDVTADDAMQILLAAIGLGSLDCGDADVERAVLGHGGPE